MTLDDIYTDFCNSISEIIVLQRNTKSILQDKIKDLNRYKENYQDLEESNIPIRSDNMFFVDSRTGENVFFGYKQLYYDEYLKFIKLKCNRDYQFYLASAYERFEDAIELIYAYLGKNDINFWPLSEFGKKRYDDIKDLDFDFYVTQSKNKKGGAIQIFKMLVERFGCDIKTNNVNLKTEIILIEKLRHIIIHNYGYTTDKEKFITTVVQDAGIFNNGNIDRAIYRYINNIFGINEYDNLVVLLDRNAGFPNWIPIPVTINIFEKLIQSIVFSIYIICEHSKKYIEGKDNKLN